MWDTEPYLSEAVSVRRAVPKRRRDFAAGRAAARSALAALGVASVAVPVGVGGAPQWPMGIVGSIAHCPGCCVAAVAFASACASLGLDVERAVPLPSELVPMVCTPAERVGLTQVPTVAGCDAAKLVFSAKESVYKALYPLTGAFLEFDDVCLLIDPSAGRFAASVT